MNYISREWIVSLAQIFGEKAGLPDNLALHETGIVAMRTATKVLEQAPWYSHLLFGFLELTSSWWLRFYRFNHKNESNLMKELLAFQNVPLISKPLLRKYRYLAALTWFEHPLVLSHYNIPNPFIPPKNPFKKTTYYLP